ncbi:hypothetical protein [Aeromicrobium flavum]|nr:hypothetical protein [Aeromicrobium flavum]
MVEAPSSLFKAKHFRNPEMRRMGGWKKVTNVEIAVSKNVDWCNHHRLHGEIGLVPRLARSQTLGRPRARALP